MSGERAERLKAAEKMHAEVRLAVKEKFLKEGFSRLELRTMINQAIGEEVRNVMAAKADAYIKEVVRDTVFQALGGKNTTVEAAKNALRAAIRSEAEKFVNERLVISTIGDQKEIW